MTFSIKLKTNRRLAYEDHVFQNGYLPVFPYYECPRYFIKEIPEGGRYDWAFIGYKILPRRFRFKFWGNCRIQINFWPLFTILIKI